MKKRCYAVVRGYRLEVPRQWPELEAAGVLPELQNGVGRDRWPKGYREALDELTGFRAAADVHDPDYCVGRTWRDRLAGDRRWLRNCGRIVWRDLGGWVGLLKMVLTVDVRRGWVAVLRLGSAWAMYRALRLGGRQAFVCATKVDLRVRGPAQTIFDDLYEGEV
jgi:hypothetical protein